MPRSTRQCLFVVLLLSRGGDPPDPPNGHQQGDLQPAREGAIHQNLSGSTRAANRYTVSRTPPIRPIQFSTLKTFDPLDEEEERGEDNDRYADIEKIEHGALLGVSRR